MASAAKKITTAGLIMPVRTSILKAISLCAAAATSTIEVFEGLWGRVDAVASVVLNAGGSGYAVNDLITIASPAAGGQSIILKVLTLSTTAVATYSLQQTGTGFTTTTGATSTSSGSGTGATFDITASDSQATSIAKLSCVANTSQPQDLCVETSAGISAKVTGSSAQGYIYYE